MPLPELKKIRQLYVVVALGAFVVSILGVLLVLYFLSATPSGERIRQSLGLQNIEAFNINSTKTERLVIEESSAIIDASKDVSQSVVSITATTKVSRPSLFFSGDDTQTVSGTGFIITNDGLIATNKHVIKDGAAFSVTTAEGKTFDAQVVGKDPTNDIALLKIEERGLPVADLGDSDKVQVGQWVIAIGNALGEFQNTVTVGVVSGLNRKAEPSDGNGSTESLDNLIQTDAAINPGNSGGPLLTLKGQVIGINTAIAGSAQNLGFVIPVNELKKSLDSYREHGKILRPYIGVRYQGITKAIAKQFELPVEEGAWIVADSGSGIIADSPAAKAGLKESDIITKVDKNAITEQNPLSKIIRQYNPNDTVELTILRDKKEQKVSLTLGTLGN